MGIHVRIVHHEKYLEFIVTGTHDLSESIDKFVQLLDECKKQGITKILIDYRELIYSAGGIERSLYALVAEDQYLEYIRSGGKELQLAYLAPMVMSWEPGAEIGKNIKYLKFELFDDRAKAITWLGLKDL